MSTVRVFELAREYGIDSKELIDRIESIGITANDHLTPLDAGCVSKIRAFLATAPSSRGVVEKQVTKTVRRRRARRPKPEDVQTPTAIEQETTVEEEPIVAETEAPAVVPEAQEPDAVVEAVEEAQPEPEVVEAAPAEPAAEEATEAEATPEETVTPAAVEEPAKTEDKPEPPQPPADDPTMERAIVVTQHVDQRIAAAVARTRAEKGYDGSAPKQRANEKTKQPEREQQFRTPDRPASDRERDNKRKQTGGRRLVYDKRREHLIRRGLIAHDDIFRGGRGKKKRSKANRNPAPAQQTVMKEAKRVVKMGDAITVGELAQKMMVKGTQVISKLMGLGVMATVNQAIDFDTAVMVADEFSWRVESVAFDVTDYVEEVAIDDDDIVNRPPVVTVMGHVDHGKTSLLDCIRNTNVTDGEAGGITQHIAAYRVELEDKGTLVFIDTPGHAAFTQMRARGAKATDVVILVVAADDGVMPQTIEAINHARAADVPIIVALNKIDKDNANPDKVLTELSEHELISEEWGGDTVVCKISALKNQGIENLLEMVLIQSELMELTASQKKPARGLVLEGRLEKGRGPVATLLVQEGVLEVGDTIVSNTVSGRVRAIHDDRGNVVTVAGPSMPVEVLGLNGVPEASEEFMKVKDDRAAGKIVDHRVDSNRLAAQIKRRPAVSLDNLHEMLEAGEVKELNVIVKSDVHGSGEALAQALEKLSHPEVAVKVIHNAVGGITESDVNLASASEAIVIGFGVRPEAKAKKLAEREKVDVKLYTIIYEAIEEVRSAMAGLLSPVDQEAQLGTAEVRETFGVPKFGTIAGCSVIEGTITRKARVRVLRDSVIIYDTTVASLRRFKDDVKEVKQGYECGVGIANFNDIKVGDLLEFYTIEQIAATLD